MTNLQNSDPEIAYSDPNMTTNLKDLTNQNRERYGFGTRPLRLQVAEIRLFDPHLEHGLAGGNGFWWLIDPESVTFCASAVLNFGGKTDFSPAFRPLSQL